MRPREGEVRDLQTGVSPLCLSTTPSMHLSPPPCCVQLQQQHCSLSGEDMSVWVHERTIDLGCKPGNVSGDFFPLLSRLMKRPCVLGLQTTSPHRHLTESVTLTNRLRHWCPQSVTQFNHIVLK